MGLPEFFLCQKAEPKGKSSLGDPEVGLRPQFLPATQASQFASFAQETKSAGVAVAAHLAGDRKHRVSIGNVLVPPLRRQHRRVEALKLFFC